MKNKKKWKQLAALLLSVAMLVPAQAVYAGEGNEAEAGMEIHAESRAADGFVIEEGVLTKYTGITTEVVIPDGVTSIGMKAFGDCSGLTSITIPGSVTEIGPGAFLGCSGLTSITIPGNVTSIGGSAFYGCSGLASITIPGSVTSIGGTVFSGCSGLVSIKVQEGNSTYDSRENCNAIINTEGNTLIAGCKNTVIPANVTNIGYEAFSGCSGLTGITIPDGVTWIGNSAFEGCSGLRNITIPDGVTIIGYATFRGCSGLRSITIPSSVTNIVTDAFSGHSEELTIYGTAGSYAESYAGWNRIKFSAVTPSQPAGKKTISADNVTISPASYAYDGKAKKPAVTVKDGNITLKEGTGYTVKYEKNVNAGTAKVIVTGKGNYKGAVTKYFTIAVKKNTSHDVGGYKYQVTDKSTVSVTGISNKKTTKVKIPKTVKIGGKTFKVTAIAKNAFKKNTKVTSIEIGDNVKTIGDSAFEGCTKLTKVTLGKGVTEVGSSVFKSCTKLGTITIKSGSLKKVGKNALKGIKATAKIKVPQKKLSAYSNLFKNKGQGKKVKVTK